MLRKICYVMVAAIMCSPIAHLDSVVHMSYRILMTTTEPVRMMDDAKITAAYYIPVEKI